MAGLLYSFLGARTEGGVEAVNKWVVSVGAAFLASLVACIFSQPGDMILTETYKRDEKEKDKKVKATTTSTTTTASTTKAFPQVIASIFQRGGIGEFFRGTDARILHVGMIITSQLVIYDIVKQALGLPATGSH